MIKKKIDVRYPIKKETTIRACVVGGEDAQDAILQKKNYLVCL